MASPDDDDDEIFFDEPSPTAPAELLEQEGPANATITSEGDSADEERLDDDDEPINWTDEDAEAVARSRRTIEPPPQPEHHRPNGEHDESASSAPREPDADNPSEKLIPEIPEDNELAAAFLATFDSLNARPSEWLGKMGVSRLAMLQYPGPIGVATIEIHPPGIFDFAEEGNRAFIQPVLSGPQYSEIIDLVAWFPRRPDRWWTLMYLACPLGIEQLDFAEFEQKPAVLRRTPLSWLVAGGEGTCILDWQVSALQLRQIPTLICEDEEHARIARQQLTMPRPRCPEIRVATEHRDAA